MRTIRTKVYKFNELSKQAKESAINWYRNKMDLDYQFVWEDINYDAKEIGLKIISLDDHRPNKGEFMLAGNEVAQNIFNNHGEGCDTYKNAKSFMKDWQTVFSDYMDENSDNYESSQLEQLLNELENEFLNSLLEDYRIMYNNNIDYLNSDESVTETITANDYEFTADGRII